MLQQWESNRKAEHSSLFYVFNGLDFKEAVSGPTDRNNQYRDMGPRDISDYQSSDAWYTSANIVFGRDFIWKEICVRLIASVNSNLELQLSSWGRIIIGLDWGEPRAINIHNPVTVALGYPGVPYIKDILDIQEYTSSGYTINPTSQLMAKPHFAWNTSIPEQSGTDSNTERFQVLWDHVFQCCVQGPCVYHHECVIPIDTLVETCRLNPGFPLANDYTAFRPNLFVFWTGPAGVDSQKCLQGMMTIEARFLDKRDTKM